ncbi:MAG: hypothetical protein ACLTY5_00965 [Angelakisella sp.]
MSFINKFKDFMGIGEEDFEDDFEENEQPEEMEDDPFGGFSMQPEYRPGKTEPAEKTAAPARIIRSSISIPQRSCRWCW